MGTAKKIIRKYWAVFWIIFVWTIFSHPYLLKGLIPFPSHNLVDYFSPWNNYFGMPVKNNAMPDVITQIYPWKTIVIDSWKLGQIPFWNPYQFAGNPLLANYQSAAFSPLNVLYFVLPFIHAWSLQILIQPLLAGLFMYLFLRKLDIGKTGSLVGSLSFMFSGFITVWMAYGTLAYAILYLPLWLYGIESYYKKASWRSAVIIVLAIPLSIFSGHFQISLYLLFVGCAYILFKYIKKRDFKFLASCCLLVVAGLVLSLPQLVPSIQFYQQATRSTAFQTGIGIPLSHIITIIAPDFFGNPVVRNDWLGYYAERSIFTGVIPFILAMFALLFGKRDRRVLFFGALAVLTFLLSFYSPLISLVEEMKVPALSTSTSSRIVVLLSFSVAILSGIGFDLLSNSRKYKKNSNIVMKYVLVWILVVVVVWVLLLSGKLFFVKDINAEKILIAKRNFILPTLMVISGGFIFWKVTFRKFFVLALLLLISFDMLRFSVKWIPFDQKEYAYPKIGPLEYLQKKAENNRVFGNFGNEAQSVFRLYGVEGRDSLYVSRYGDLVWSSSTGNLQKIYGDVVNVDKNGRNTKKMLDLLGVRYILHSIQDKHNVWAFPFWDYPDSFGKPVWSDDVYEVYENMDAFPRAFVVFDYLVANNDQEIISYITDDSLDLRDVVILEQEPKLEIDTTKECSKNVAEIIEYTPNKVIINVETDCPGLLFLSDNYYPGWNVYVNGNKQKILRANYTFRAVEVPVGNSEVVFKYENWYF